MKQDLQKAAQDLYVHTFQSQSTIADNLGLDRKTIYNWAKNGKWDDLKVAARQTPTSLLQDVYKNISAVQKQIDSRDANNRCPTMHEVDMLRKLYNITKCVKRKNPGTYMEVFNDIVEYAKKEDTDFARKLRNLMDRMLYATLQNKNIEAEEERSELLATLQKVDEETCPITYFDPANPTETEFPIPDQSGENGEFSENQNEPTHTPEPLPVHTYENNHNSKDEIKFPKNIFSPVGKTDPVPLTTTQEQETNKDQSLLIDQYRKWKAKEDHFESMRRNHRD